MQSIETKIDFPESRGLTRKQFLLKGIAAIFSTRLLLAAATGGAALFAFGCDVFTDIADWVPVGLAAFNSVVSLLASAGVINPGADAAINLLIQTITNIFAQLKQDIADYKAITPAPVGALAKIQATLGLIVQNLQSFLNSINVQDSKLLALVVGLAQIILGTIAAFQNKLSSAGAPVPSVPATGRTRMSRQSVAIVPHERSVRQFKHDFNAAAKDGGHPEIEIK